MVSVQLHRVQHVVVRSPGRVKLNNMVAATIQQKQICQESS